MARNPVRACGLFLLFPALALASAAHADVAELLARGDAAFQRRSDGHDGNGRASLAPVEQAIAAYEEALRGDADALGAPWRLLRALHFAGEFASPDDETSAAFFERARRVAEDAFLRLERASGSGGVEKAAAGEVAGLFAPDQRADVARIHFWSAIAWASWSRTRGTLAVVREGVAGRLHRYAERVVALEPTLERGGAHRLLCTLHASLPRVPFLTGWVDRERALPELDRALAVAPDFAGNRLLLGLTLLDLAPERRTEALSALEEVAAIRPDQEDRVEQLALREAARRRLAEERGAAD